MKPAEKGLRPEKIAEAAEIDQSRKDSLNQIAMRYVKRSMSKR